jgi:peptidyl-prolyl cis-trans isomerase B (cyclophilin B)
MKQLAIYFFILVMLACSQKKESGPVTKESLLKYGAENPETGVVIETDLGVIKLKLYEDTPLHRANFVKLIKEGHYDDGDFYRIITYFMIQGGDAENQPKYTIPAEFNSKYIHKRGTVSMARVDENNPNKESSSAEFFVVHGGPYTEEEVEEEARALGLNLTPEQKQTYVREGGYMSLDQQYTIFGEVVEGLDVVDKIAREKVHGIEKPKRKIAFKISVVNKI